MPPESSMIDRGLDRRNQIGGMGLERGEDRLDRKQKQARIPQIPPLGQHLGGAVGIGFFDKPLQRQRARAVRGVSQFEIAVTRLGARGRDAKDNDVARARGFGPALYRDAKGLGIGHHVIGGGHQHQSVRRLGPQVQGRGQDRRRGIAPRRLD